MTADHEPSATFVISCVRPLMDRATAINQVSFVLWPDRCPLPHAWYQSLHCKGVMACLMCMQCWQLASAISPINNACHPGLAMHQPWHQMTVKKDRPCLARDHDTDAVHCSFPPSSILLLQAMMLAMHIKVCGNTRSPSLRAACSEGGLCLTEIEPWPRQRQLFSCLVPIWTFLRTASWFWFGLVLVWALQISP